MRVVGAPIGLASAAGGSGSVGRSVHFGAPMATGPASAWEHGPMRCDRFVRVALRFAGPSGTVDLERLVGISATPCERDAVAQSGGEWLCVDHWMRAEEPGDPTATGAPEVHELD